MNENAEVQLGDTSWPGKFVAYEVCGIPVVQDSAVIPGYFVVGWETRKRLQECVGAKDVEKEFGTSVVTFEVEGTPVKYSSSVMEGRIAVHPDTWRPLARDTFGGK
jgi:hypothetical protein